MLCKINKKVLRGFKYYKTSKIMHKICCIFCAKHLYLHVDTQVHRRTVMGMREGEGWGGGYKKKKKKKTIVWSVNQSQSLC